MPGPNAGSALAPTSAHRAATWPVPSSLYNKNLRPSRIALAATFPVILRRGCSEDEFAAERLDEQLVTGDHEHRPEHGPVYAPDLAIGEVDAVDADSSPGLADQRAVVSIGCMEAYVAVGAGAC